MKQILAAVVLLLFTGCSTTAIQQQHPAFALNTGECAVVGAAIPLLGIVPGAGTAVGSLVGAVVTKAFCSAEDSAVNGPPAVAVQTVTSTTTKTVSNPVVSSDSVALPNSIILPDKLPVADIVQDN